MEWIRWIAVTAIYCSLETTGHMSMEQFWTTLKMITIPILYSIEIFCSYLTIFESEDAVLLTIARKIFLLFQLELVHS